MGCKHTNQSHDDRELGRMYGNNYDIVKVIHSMKCVDCGKTLWEHCDSHRETHEGYIDVDQKSTLDTPSRFGT